MIRDEDMVMDNPADDHVVRGPVVVCTLVASLAFAAFVVAYARFAEPAIERMDRSLGVVQFEKGQRFQEAGEYANAIQCYKLALDGEFEDPKYRTFTLKALGTLLWWREEPKVALPYLEEVYAQPKVPVSLYAPLCDSLLQVGRIDDIPPVCDRWRRDAASQNDPEQQAQAMYYLGKVLQKRGDEAGARESFSQGLQFSPGGFNAYELGVSYYESGEFEKALTYLDLFLERGTGGRADYARNLRTEILGKRGQQP